jgi:hypothetical protein
MSKRVKIDNSSKVVFSFFDLSGVLVKPWADAGYECHIIDMQHEHGMTKDGNITRWGMDVYEWEKTFLRDHKDKIGRAVFAAFFPPCTDLAVSGARWFEDKESRSPGTRKRAMDLVLWSDRIGRMLGCPYFIENPVSVISSEWRKPDFWFHPYEFGGYSGGGDDGYTKKTCLWTGGGFELPEHKPIRIDPKTGDRIHRMPPSTERANMRSQTPRGFARALFELNAKQ